MLLMYVDLSISRMYVPFHVSAPTVCLSFGIIQFSIILMNIHICAFDEVPTYTHVKQIGVYNCMINS